MADPMIEAVGRLILDGPGEWIGSGAQLHELATSIAARVHAEAEAEHRADLQHRIEVSTQYGNDRRLALAERDEYHRNWQEAEKRTGQAVAEAVAAERQRIKAEIEKAIPPSARYMPRDAYNGMRDAFRVALDIVAAGSVPVATPADVLRRCFESPGAAAVMHTAGSLTVAGSQTCGWCGAVLADGTGGGLVGEWTPVGAWLVLDRNAGTVRVVEPWGGELEPAPAVITFVTTPAPVAAVPTGDHADLPTLDGITDELAEHSAKLDHALDQRPDGSWFCRACPDPVATPTGPMRDALRAELAERRADPEFRERLAERVKTDRPILDRLAASPVPAEQPGPVDEVVCPNCDAHIRARMSDAEQSDGPAPGVLGIAMGTPGR